MDIKFIQDLFAYSVAPIAVVDSELLVIYANEAAKAIYINLSVPNGLYLMIPSQALDEYKFKIRNQESFCVSDATFSISQTKLVFTPYDGGALVSFSNNIDNSYKTEGVGRSIAALTGQMRSPLSNIFAMLGVVSQRLHSEGEYSLDKYLSEISQSSYLLLREVVNLSELIKHNACMPENSEKVIDLWSFLHSSLESASALTKSLSIPLEYDLPQSVFPVCCDSNRLLCALFNIISNSCRFTKEGNKIIVTGNVKDNNAIITVTDHGLGIPSKYIGQVFEPFFSYDPDGTPFAGTGIGLTVARLIISSYGGNINISSVELEGTSVAFTLPMSTKEYDLSTVTVCEHAVDFLRNRFSPLYIGMCQVCSGPSL